MTSQVSNSTSPTTGNSMGHIMRSETPIPVVIQTKQVQLEILSTSPAVPLCRFPPVGGRKVIKQVVASSAGRTAFPPHSPLRPKLAVQKASGAGAAALQAHREERVSTPASGSVRAFQRPVKVVSGVESKVETIKPRTLASFIEEGDDHPIIRQPLSVRSGRTAVLGFR